MNYINLHPNSFTSLYIEIMFNDFILATGTAFLSGIDNKFMLFTNKHNVTGKNIITGEILDTKNQALPNKIVVMIRMTESNGQEGFISKGCIKHTIPLYEDSDKFLDPTWIEHDDNGVDVVGLICNPPDIDIQRLIIPCEETWYQCDVGSRVNIIGYPLNLAKNGDDFPIWMSGYIASEPLIDMDKKPLLYVDSRTRKGQSGSPVIYQIKIGDVVVIEGQPHFADAEGIFLLGIYSGRVSDDSDIGRVWKTKVLRDILNKKFNTIVSA